MTAFVKVVPPLCEYMVRAGATHYKPVAFRKANLVEFRHIFIKPVIMFKFFPFKIHFDMRAFQRD